MRFAAAVSSKSVPPPWLAAAAVAVALAGCADLRPAPQAGIAPADAVRQAALPRELAPARSGTIADEAPAGPAAAVGEAVPDGWRRVVVDPRLTRIVEAALANNRDLRVAALNIEAARARYRIADAALWPKVNAAAGATASGSDAAQSPTPSSSRQYQVTLGVASWELDLWGRIGALSRSALDSYLATEATRDSVRASLVADTAQAWLTLAADERLLALARQTSDTRAQSLALTRKRRELGAAAASDVATAEAAVETALGDLALARTNREQALNALRLLLGSEPAAADLPGADEAGAETAAALVEVPAGLPSTVLLRRPDVRAAERQLQGAQADVDAARAALFPTLSLTANAGSASTSLAGLFKAGSGSWSFGPTLSLPIFDGGAARASLAGAQVAQQVQLANYEKTLQTAFRESADALALRAEIARRIDAQRRLVAASQRILDLTARRHQAGAESALAVLDAERSLYAARQSLIALQLSDQSNRITLYKVLGGS